MERNQKILTAVLVGVILAVAVIAGFALKKHKPVVKQIQEGVNKTEAPKGELISGFPKELIIGTGQTDNSYKIDYNNANQYTANLQSDSSVLLVYNQYLRYFNTNGYT